ncbi:MAG: twin-arginine translocase subunit TatC, partial [Thermoplasmata archaeon]
REKKLLINVTVPATLLFITGAVFAYIFVVPFVFDFLYRIAANMVDQMFLSPGGFIDFTLAFLFGFGLAFELPVIMVGLSALGIVTPGFWKRNWRYATVAIFIFGAVITPDGSGVTMFLVATPMLVLYLMGYLISKRKYGNR